MSVTMLQRYPANTGDLGNSQLLIASILENVRKVKLASSKEPPGISLKSQNFPRFSRELY